MKSLIKIFGFAILLAATTIACVDDDTIMEESCTSEFLTPVAEVTGPETVAVGQSISFTVKFNAANGCYTGATLIESGTNPKEITVKAFYSGCVCTQQLVAATKRYVFTGVTPGEYVLKFRAAGNSFITKTVTVTQ